MHIGYAGQDDGGSGYVGLGIGRGLVFLNRLMSRTLLAVRARKNLAIRFSELVELTSGW